jgi:hypothetical protein
VSLVANKNTTGKALGGEERLVWGISTAWQASGRHGRCWLLAAGCVFVQSEVGRYLQGPRFFHGPRERYIYMPGPTVRSRTI